MADSDIVSAGFGRRLVESLRDLDPGGARAVFAVYVTAFAGAAALLGYQIGLVLADPAEAQGCAVFAAVTTSLAVALAHPRTGPRFLSDVAACLGGIAVAALAGALAAAYPLLGQPLLVLVAFAAFYLRRWGEPWPSVGTVAMFTYIPHQILGQLVTPALLNYAVIATLLLAAVGMIFLPRRAFAHGVVAAARRMRGALAPMLGGTAPVGAEAAGNAVARIEALLRQVVLAREKADLFDPAAATESLAIVHEAAIAARVWENLMDGLARMKGASDPLPDVRAAVRAARLAVADALANSDPARFEAAREALRRVDAAIASPALRVPVPDKRAEAASLYLLLAIQQTLSHLLDAAAALDRRVGTERGAAGSTAP